MEVLDGVGARGRGSLEAAVGGVFGSAGSIERCELRM